MTTTRGDRQGRRLPALPAGAPPPMSGVLVTGAIWGGGTAAPSLHFRVDPESGNSEAGGGASALRMRDIRRPRSPFRPSGSNFLDGSRPASQASVTAGSWPAVVPSQRSVTALGTYPFSTNQARRMRSTREDTERSSSFAARSSAVLMSGVTRTPSGFVLAMIALCLRFY